jgi:Orange carotenoid protein, N-terminal
MSPNPNTSGTAYLPQKTQQVVDAFDALDTDAKLALLYFIYEKMGESITPAAPAATEPELAPALMGDFYDLSKEDQLAVMREIVNGDDTEMSRAYGAIKENNQLMVWFAWAQAMGDTVVGMPQGYEATDAIKQALGHLEDLDFQEQISFLREIAGSMGHSDVQPIASQAETGKTASL